VAPEALIEPGRPRLYDGVVALRGILFDFDGTLADTPGAERTAWPDVAAVIERHVPELDHVRLHDRYHTLFERHWTDYLAGRIDFVEYRRRRLSEAIAPWREVDDELFQDYRAAKRRGLEELRLFDDALETLRAVRSAGLRAGLLTNGPSELQRRKITLTRIEPELDAIAISEEIGVAKPAGEAFVPAAAMIGCGPREVAMVGDSPEADIAGATGAGVALAVLVTRGLPLEASGASTISGLRELADVLGPYL
jgi:HAD superfamily hydrolase (TIGR01549 family)